MKNDSRAIKAKTQKTMIKHIERFYSMATPEEIADGRDWYADARSFARRMAFKYSATVPQVAQIIAVLSPRISWEQNKANAEKFLAYGADVKIFATRAQKQKCAEILTGSYAIPETAQKTFSFAENIAELESPRVTVDRHASKIAINDLRGGSVSITKKNYLEFESAYKKSAERLGLRPYELQAITWITYKRVVNR